MTLCTLLPPSTSQVLCWLSLLSPPSYTLMDYVNAYPAVVGMGLPLATTAILGLVFIPRMRNSIITVCVYYLISITFLWLWSCLHSDAIIFVDVMCCCCLLVLFLADGGAL